jgi:pyrimidine-nucleoside phosphorylase
MLFVELIRKKRDGNELSRQEIEAIVAAYTRNEIPDYQVSAFLMAALIRGLSRAETADLTNAMLNSGQVLDFSELKASKVDKHSTGGVGDKTSLILSPLVAAAGLYVPMISGRGLGHTGGTLDKLEAIPGFSVNFSLTEFRRTLAAIGCAMIGQTAEVAPADKKLYALRDVTGTVESPYLICASIMSKKLAEGVDALVLDVKTGSGAFMKDQKDSEFLAELMVETGVRMGKRIVALITGMDEPLGRAVGNALEVEECIALMKGERKGSEDLYELTMDLAAWMLYLGHRTESVEEGRALAEELMANGATLAKFRELVAAQGGDPAICDDASLLPKAKHTVELVAESDGYIQSTDCHAVGVASVVLGGGRFTKEDVVNPVVGLLLHKKIGDRVARGESLCTIHYDDEKRMTEAREMLRAAYQIGAQEPAARPPLVRKILEGKPAQLGAHSL